MRLDGYPLFELESFFSNKGDEQIPTGQTESMVVWQRMLICGKTGTFYECWGKISLK